MSIHVALQLTVAYGRDFGDVSPVAGILTGGGRHTVKVAVDMTGEASPKSGFSPRLHIRLAF